MQKIKIFFMSDVIQLISRLILGRIFFYASLGKILYNENFLIELNKYKLIPQYFLKFIGFSLPLIELAVGLMLIFSIFSRTSALILSSLLIVFILAITSALIRGINISCGCFIQRLIQEKNSFRLMEGIYIIIRDILFLIPGFIIIFFNQPRKKAN